MRRLRCLLPLVLLSACATVPHLPDSPVRNVRYSAAGNDPNWTLVVGDDELAFREAGEVWRLMPRPLEQVINGVRIWESGEPAAGIVVERRPGPCEDPQGQVFEERVRVLLTGDRFGLRDGSISRYREELSGCGGQLSDQEEARW